jgi:glycosyltransferase involved in cell wall biosynthesis
VAPFDLTINHWDPGNLDIQEPARKATSLAVAWCVDEQTEILTQRGWLRWDEVAEGDQALGIDPAVGVSEWQEIREVYRSGRACHEMVRLIGSGHESLTTPNHRWLILDAEGRWRWSTTEVLQKDDRIPCSAPCADQPPTPKFSDAFVELVAWTYTEGWLERGSSVRIGQNERVNPDKTARIRGALRSMLGEPVSWIKPCACCGGPPSDGRGHKRLRGRGLCGACHERHRVAGSLSQWPSYSGWTESPRKPDGMVIFNVSRPVSAELLAACPGKVPSLDFLRSLTLAQLELFIAVSLLADGTAEGVFAQTRGPRLDAFVQACVLAGKRPSRPRRTSHDHLATLALLRTPHARLAGESSREMYEGVIWCPSVRHGNWLARRDGHVFYTGNTMWEFSPATEPAEVMRYPRGAKPGDPKVPVKVQPKVGGLYPICKNRSTFTRRMKWYDLVLGYDPVSLAAIEPLLPDHVKRGILLGGYDSQNWRPVERDWHGDQFGFAMHGALNNRKQPYLVLQAHLELRDEHPDYAEQARLSFHTTIPPLFPELNEILNKAGDQRVRIFYDTWDDATLKQFYAANHCLVYPSQGEGKNVPCLEFMSTGGTVIHTKRGGPQMWLNEDVGYEVPFVLRPVVPKYPDGCHSARVDLAELKRVMLHVFRNRGEARQKGELASRLIPQQLDWEVVVSDLFRRIRDLCGHQGEIIYNAAMADRQRAQEHDPFR